MTEVSKQCAVWELTIGRIKLDGTEWSPEFVGQSLKKLFKFLFFSLKLERRATVIIILEAHYLKKATKTRY